MHSISRLSPLTLAKPNDAVTTLLGDSHPVSRRVMWITAAMVVAAYATLWTGWFYPNNDSALYMVLARNWAGGQGISYAGMPYHRVPFLVPVMLGIIIKAGGGVGAIHVVMMLLTLASHAMCFLTLRRWLGERWAFYGALSVAVQAWTFRSGMTIMTEPPFLAGIWGGLLCLSHVSQSSGWRRWALVLGGCACMGLAFSSRIAVAALLPGVLVALWLTARRTASLEHRLAWVGIFVVVFGVLSWKLLRGGSDEGMGIEEGVGRGTEHLGKGDVPFSQRYHIAPFGNVVGQGVNWAFRVLVVGGRWINETFVAGARRFGMAKGGVAAIIGVAGALFSLTCVIWGWCALYRRKYWWLVWPALYGLPFWILWGSRVIPRYLVPVSPLLFVMLCAGMTALAVRAGGWFMKDAADRVKKVSHLIPPALVILFAVANSPAWAVDMYVYKLSRYQLYDVLRQGAFAELVDIGAYLRQNASPADTVAINTIVYERLVYWLSDHDVEMRGGLTPVRAARDDDPEAVKRYLGNTEAKYVVIYAATERLPEWHLPLRSASKASPQYWSLYERGEGGDYRRVFVPKAREYARRIPRAVKTGPATRPAHSPPPGLEAED